MGGILRVWDGNVIKLGCDDHCTIINVIHSLSNINLKKIKKRIIQKKKKPKICSTQF